MSEPDRRSYRVALVADRYVNPRAGGLDAIPVLLECQWGAIHLPSDRYSVRTAALLLEQIAEQAEEFHRRGYALVLIGKRSGLGRALKAVGVPMPEQIEPKTPAELRAFLRRERSRADRPPSRPGPPVES